MVLKFQNGAAVVPLRELRVTESSESVLAGTKRPPFRLVVRAIKPDGRRLNIRPAVSEEFVVRAHSLRPCAALFCLQFQPWRHVPNVVLTAPISLSTMSVLIKSHVAHVYTVLARSVTSQLCVPQQLASAVCDRLSRDVRW